MTIATDQADYEGWNTSELLEDLIRRVFRDRIALVSSFGTESAVLLHVIAQIDRRTPVIFLDTGKLFPETLAYRDTLIDRLRLHDVRVAQPNPSTLAMADPEGRLWQQSPDQCCWHRKVEPLDEVLSGFGAWITGRKRYHGGERSELPLLEREPDGRTKINPLVSWSQERLALYMTEHDLPRHPLLARGFRSIGCAPCTRVAAPSDDPRAGRWAGTSKTECGIHLPRVAVVSPSRI